MRLPGNAAARNALVHDPLLPDPLVEPGEVSRALVRKIEDLRRDDAVFKELVG